MRMDRTFGRTYHGKFEGVKTFSGEAPDLSYRKNHCWVCNAVLGRSIRFCKPCNALVRSENLRWQYRTKMRRKHGYKARSYDRIENSLLVQQKLTNAWIKKGEQ